MGHTTSRNTIHRIAGGKCLKVNGGGPWSQPLFFKAKTKFKTGSILSVYIHKIALLWKKSR
jgi:hypothetical protein